MDIPDTGMGDNSSYPRNLMAGDGDIRLNDSQAKRPRYVPPGRRTVNLNRTELK